MYGIEQNIPSSWPLHYKIIEELMHTVKILVTQCICIMLWFNVSGIKFLSQFGFLFPICPVLINKSETKENKNQTHLKKLTQR